MKNLLIATVAAVVLTACGSAVKLDNVGVEDRTGKATLAETQPALPWPSGIPGQATRTPDQTNRWPP